MSKPFTVYCRITVCWPRYCFLEVKYFATNMSAHVKRAKYELLTFVSRKKYISIYIQHLQPRRQNISLVAKLTS